MSDDDRGTITTAAATNGDTDGIGGNQQAGGGNRDREVSCQRGQDAGNDELGAADGEGGERQVSGARRAARALALEWEESPEAREHIEPALRAVGGH